MKQFYTFFIFISLIFYSDALNAQVKYATRVTAFSSQYRTGSWNAQMASGIPDVVGCGDYGNAWASKTTDDHREWLELEFDAPAPVSRIYIHETYNPGAVDTVYVLNPHTQLFEKVYEATAKPGAPCPRALAVSFPMTSFPVSKIRIALNSPAVSGYNEIDAVGVAAYTDGGAIAAAQEVCATAAAAPFTNAESAFGGDPAAQYQWQDSTENGSWQDIANAQTASFQAPVVTRSTWYRRKAGLAGVTEFSNIVKLTYHESGDPAVFPVNAWNFYLYQSKQLNLGSSVYKGFYSRTALNFNTRNDWPIAGVPSVATGYQGCTVNNNDFVLAARRKGFPAGNYILQVIDFRGGLRAYVNGVEMPAPGCCSGTISLGSLNQDSEVEIRMLDVSADVFANLVFSTAALNGGDIGEAQTICLDETPAGFTSNIAAFGGAAPASITYQWQDSVSNGSWKNILNAASLIYQSGALAETTWFRRKAADNTGAEAYSDEIKLTVNTKQGDTTLFGNQNWHLYAFNGNDITLATGNYRGFYSRAGLNIVTTDHWSYWESPSSAVDYLGCPVNIDYFVLSARRQGFPAGQYQLNLTVADDQVMVLVDGLIVHTGGAANIVLGTLDAGSKVELRLREATYTGRMVAEFVRVDYNISDFIHTGCRSFALNNVKGNEWYDFTDATGKLIASINPNGNDLGTVTLNTKHYGTGTASVPVNSLNNKKYMPRYFNFSSSAYPSTGFPSPVKLRLYFKNSELQDYGIAIAQPSLTRGELGIAHYSGSREDCEMNNNANGGELLLQPVAADFTAAGFYLEAMTGSFSEFGILKGSPVLPVKLTRFRAEPQGHSIKLVWTTVQEIDNKGFELLRSSDGQHFNPIGWVDGHGNTTEQVHYSFADINPAAGKNFYRLRQVDIDQRSSYSDIVMAYAGKGMALNLSPNPVGNILYIGIDDKQTTAVKVLDMQGRILWRYEGNGGNNVLPVPVRHLKKGMYLVEWVNKQGKRQTGKFLKK